MKKPKNKPHLSKEDENGAEKNKAQITHITDSKTRGLGIPQVLRVIRFEKNIVTVPVKLPPTLATYIRTHGGSTWIRAAILKALRKEAK